MESRYEIAGMKLGLEEFPETLYPADLADVDSPEWHDFNNWGEWGNGPTDPARSDEKYISDNIYTK